MFTLIIPTQVTLNVHIEVPIADPHKRQQSMSINCKYLSMSEREALVHATTEKKMRDEDWMLDHIVGWHGVKTEDGEILPFSRDNLRKLMDIPYARHAIIKSVTDELILGTVDEKNLYPPSATGQAAEAAEEKPEAPVQSVTPETVN